MKRPALSAREVKVRSAIVERAFLDFGHFVQLMWPVLEPSRPLLWGWWMDAICGAIQRQVEGDPACRWLLVNQPPGTAKSMLCSVFRPAWTLWRYPHRNLFYLSTSDTVASRDSRKTRELLRCDEGPGLVLDRDPHRPWWPSFAALVQYAHDRRKAGLVVPGQGVEVPVWKFAEDQDTKVNFQTSARGGRFCLAMGSRLTGPRGDDVIVDDPVDINEVIDVPPETRRRVLREAQGTVDWVLETRVNGPESTRTVVMQRVDEDDPAGVALRSGDPWHVVDIRMEFDPSRRHPLDPRTRPGELLCPAMWPVDDIERKKRKLRGQYQAQYNQDPRREEGGLIAREVVSGLRRWVENPVERCDEVLISVDCTFKGGEQNDRVAIHAWGREGEATFYLLDRDTRHMGYLQTKAAIRAMREKFPVARVVLVEDKANGSAVVEDLGQEFPGLVPFNPGVKSKFERAKVALLPALEARNVVLPAESVAPWVAEVEVSWVGMRPGGKDDDDVDAASMVMARWGLGKRGKWVDGLLPPLPPVAVVPLAGTGPDEAEERRWAMPEAAVSHVAGIHDDRCVVLDGAGVQVAAIEGVEGTGWVSALRAWPGVTVGVAGKDAATRVLAWQLAAAGYNVGVVDIDIGMAREALVARRLRCRDARLHGEMEDASAGDPPSSSRFIALCAAWSRGVSRGMLAPPGRDRPLPTATESRVERWGMVAGGETADDPWGMVAGRLGR